MTIQLLRLISRSSQFIIISILLLFSVLSSSYMSRVAVAAFRSTSSTLSTTTTTTRIAQARRKAVVTATTTTPTATAAQAQGQRQVLLRAMSSSSPSPTSAGVESSSTNNYNGIIFHWFRLGDLRLHDNPALHRSIQLCSPSGTSGNDNNLLIPIFCFDPTIFGDKARSSTTGGLNSELKCCPKRAQFILDSVIDLKRSLKERGSDIVLAPTNTPPEEFMKLLVNELKQTLSKDSDDSSNNKKTKKQNIKTKVIYQEEVCSEERNVAYRVNRVFNNNKEAIWGSTLYDIKDLPYYDNDQHKKGLLDSMPNTFTPFRNKVEKQCQIHSPIPIPNKIPCIPQSIINGCVLLKKQITYIPTSLSELGYTKEQIEFASCNNNVDPRGVMAESGGFKGGETAGLARVKEYIWDKDLLSTYFDTRNGMIGKDYSTKFSPWLAHGNVSPRYIAYECKKYEEQRIANKSTYWVVFELLWRDFYKFFALKHGNSIFFPGGTIGSDKEWSHYEKNLQAWKAGRTGFPLVDANMRELQATGFMSNRGRQNVCSFLALELNEDWRYGAEYFESILIDHDVYSNWGNWCAGAGMTGGRLNRFNIVKQSKDYDQHGEYVKLWLPELKNVPTKFVHEPWKMNQLQQAEYNCRLGVDYPNPIVKPFYPKHSNNNNNTNGGGGGRKGNNRKGKNGGGKRDGDNPNRGRGQRRDMKSLKQGSWSISG